MNILFPTRHHPFMVSISKPYVLQLKTVRSRYGNRTVFNWRTDNLEQILNRSIIYWFVSAKQTY